ncbi:MAG: polyprenyl synthetase family protein [Bacteroidales bacterium]|nr:polyprenyl synthetase family protein [Bacteroidales bacterium]
MPENLYNPIDYILQQGGKRLRPNLVRMSAKMFGADDKAVGNVAAAFEMLHNFTLIHDDIMDEAPIRRGKPTVYKKWNGNVAILAGDALATLAVQEMLKTPARAEIVLQLVSLLGQTSIEVCEGQQLDLDFETRDDVSIDDYIEMIRLKTAVMLAGCLKAGALLAATSDEDAAHIYNCGIFLGLAFQLRDDLLDVYADEAEFGKMIGGDIKENKKTYLFLRALADASESQHEKLRFFFSSDNVDFDKKFSAIKQIYADLDIKSKTEAEILKYVSLSLEELMHIHVADSLKGELKGWIEQLTFRNK